MRTAHDQEQRGTADRNNCRAVVDNPLVKKVKKKISSALTQGRGSNLVPRVFSLFNMAAAREKTLAHSDLKRSLIGAILTWVLIGLRLPKAKMADLCGFFPQPKHFYSSVSVMWKLNSFSVWQFTKLQLFRMRKIWSTRPKIRRLFGLKVPRSRSAGDLRKNLTNRQWARYFRVLEWQSLDIMWRSGLWNT